MNDLLTRAVSNVVPMELAQKKLQSQTPLRLYMGIDPTGSRLHVGHAVPLRKMKAFADAGHEVIFLIGSFTAMIGDPSGRDTMREPLTKEQVEKNFQSYKEQASAILDFSKVQIRYNHEWLESLGFADIAHLASNFTVQQMLERDMFEKRIAEGNPISVTEFLYPLMVGYDSVMLDVDVELGGNDQLFNMLAGRTLQKASGKREKFVMTMKLLEGTDGRKMSKTYNNCIYLDDAPSDMYGKVMRIHDNVMETYFECCTDLSMEEIATILQGNPREAKGRLAEEIVTLYHGKESAVSAANEFLEVFAKGGIPDDVPEISATNDQLLLDILTEKGIITSKSEGRRLIEQGAIKRGDAVITTIEEPAQQGIYKIGKKKFVRII